MKRTLCIYHDYLDEDLLKRVEERAKALDFTVFSFDSRNPEEREESRRILPDAEVLYANSPKALSACSEKLRWFSCMYAGVDPYIRHPEYFPSDRIVMTNSNVYGPTISEYVILVLLDMMRRMDFYREGIKNKKWIREQEIDSIMGNAFLILGTGNLGLNIARKLRGMDAGKVVGINRSGVFKSRNGEENPFDEIYTMAALKELLPQVKAVIMALPDTGETDMVMNRETIGLLGKDAYLVNVGRGNALDRDALLEALDKGLLKGAALDVLAVEPPKEEDPVWTAKNLYLTPHISGNNGLRYTRELGVELFLDNLQRYTEGKPLKAIVDRKKGY